MHFAPIWTAAALAIDNPVILSVIMLASLIHQPTREQPEVHLRGVSQESWQSENLQCPTYEKKLSHQDRLYRLT